MLTLLIYNFYFLFNHICWDTGVLHWQWQPMLHTMHPFTDSTELLALNNMSKFEPYMIKF